MATVADRSGNLPVGVVGPDYHRPTPTRPHNAVRSDLVVPSDTVNLPVSADRLIVGVAGTVTVVRPDDSTRQYTTSAVNEIIRGPVKRVNATGTAATGITAEY